MDKHTKTSIGVALAFILIFAGFQLFERVEPRLGLDSEISSEEEVEADNTGENTYVPSSGGTEASVSGEGSSAGGIPQADISRSLALPFSFYDIDEKKGYAKPLGVVMSSGDESGIGSTGIDIPLEENAEITAVADGEIVLIENTNDRWGGKRIVQLLKWEAAGEGWAFIYEPVKLHGGTREGENFNKGEIIGTKVGPSDNPAHFELAYNFNWYKSVRYPQCWPDFLADNDQSELAVWWRDYKETETLTDGWNNDFENGKYPLRMLLDETVYITGPRLCYPLGTDAR